MDDNVQEFIDQRDRMIQEWVNTTNELFEAERAFIAAQVRYKTLYDKARELSKELGNASVLRQLTQPTTRKRNRAKTQ